MSMLRKLLLADDSLTIQKVVELVLAHENFEIKAVNDGELAFEAFGYFNPDIVLADIEMPKMNGYQLCEKIKNNPATAHTPVILLAGAFEPFDEEYAKSVGAEDYIIKPFESQELISKIKSLLLNAEASRPPVTEHASEEIALVQEEQAAASAEGGDGSLEEPPSAEGPSPSEGQKWEEEVPILREEKPDGQETADEDYEAKVALSSKGFADELMDALKEERAPASVASLKELAESLQMPSKDDISEIIRKAVDEKVSAMIAHELMPAVSVTVKDAAEKAIAGVAPRIIEDVVRESVRELFGTMRNEIDAAIGRIVPQVAEAIIRKEIEKITSEL